MILLARLLDFIGYLFFRPPKTLKINPKKILVVRLDQLGDIMQTLPALHEIRKTFPEAEIHVLTSALGKQIMDLAHVAKATKVWDCRWFDSHRTPQVGIREVIRWISLEKFDCAFELRGDVRLILLLRWAGVQTLIGTGATGGGFMLDVDVPWNKDQHAIEKNLALIQAVGGDGGGRNPDLSHLVSNKKVDAKKIAVHPDAGTSAKKWPLSSYVEVIDDLQSHGFSVVLVGLDKTMGEKIVSQTKVKPINLMGQTNFQELVATLQGCGGLLTNDSGPAHVMAALGKPVWILWSGTAEPTIWAPRGPNIKLFSSPVPCSPCSLSECPVPGHPCLTRITVKSVTSHILESV